MSKDRLRITSATPRIRKDGAEIEIALEAKNRKSVTVVIDAPQLQSLLQALFEMHAIAKHSSATMPADDPSAKEFEGIPQVLLVRDMTLVDYAETKGASIRVETTDRQVVQLEFQPNHLQFLLDSLRSTGSLGPDLGKH